MSRSDLLAAMVDHMDEADLPSTDEVVQLVCEVFISAFRADRSQSAGPAAASAEEAQQDALQLALSLYNKASKGSQLRGVLSLEKHHPTSALFLQHAIALAFPSSGERSRAGKELQRQAMAFVEVVGEVVGRPTLQRLLPGVASSASKYLCAYLPRRGAHCQHKSALIKAADVLRQWIDACFGLEEDGTTPQWTEVDARWASSATPKLIPLLFRFLDANVVGDVVVDVPIAVVRPLAPLTRSLLRGAWHRGGCPPAVARSLICTLVLLRHIIPDSSSGARMEDGICAWLDLRAPADAATTASNEIHDKEDNIMSTVASWESLMEFTFALSQKFGAAYVTSLTTMVMMATASNHNAAEWRTILTHDDASVLWRSVRRALKYCADPHASVAMDDVNLLQRTARERRRSMPGAGNTKSHMDLLDALLAAVGRLSVEFDDIGESLLVHAEDVLQDWSEFAVHPQVLYAITRIVVFGSLPPQPSAAAAVQCLQQFVQMQTFETLWEIVSLEHLWKIEIDSDKCTFQELQHRGVVARTILGAIRQTAECLGDLTQTAKEQRDEDSGIQRPAGDVNVILERFVLLCLYQTFEKESCPFGDVHEAAEMTVRALSELHAQQDDTLAFFFAHCRNVTDEARRAVMDPEFHAGAIRVVSGLTRFLGKCLFCSNGHTTNCADGGSSPTPLQLPASHRSQMAVFVQDVVEMIVSSITEWQQRKTPGPILGCLGVLKLAVKLVVTLTHASPRAYPSNDDWDDERRWTSTEPQVALLQELVWTTVMQKVHSTCMLPNTAIAARSIEITMDMLELFRAPPRVPSEEKHTSGVHDCEVIRTHLNTLHKVYHVLEDLLVASWNRRKEDAVEVLHSVAPMVETPSSVDNSNLAPASRRTKRSTLLHVGRWLSELPVPVELPELVGALSSLMALARGFLAPRMAEEAAPAILLWYTRCTWMVHVPTRREEASRQACVAFLQGVVEAASASGFADVAEGLRKRCKSVVDGRHWQGLRPTETKDTEARNPDHPVADEVAS